MQGGSSTSTGEQTSTGETASGGVHTGEATTTTTSAATPTTGEAQSTSTSTGSSTSGGSTTGGGDDTFGFIGSACLDCVAGEVCVQLDGGDFSPPPKCKPANGCVPTDPCSPECAALCGDFAVCEVTDSSYLFCASPHQCDISDSPFYLCGDGEKCNPADPLKHGIWSGTACVPLDPDADEIGEPCTVEGDPYSGVDTCVAGALCWAVDPETLEGTCLELCTMDFESTCETPGTLCALFSADLPLCLRTCDPLVQDCEEGESCFMGPVGGSCLPDISGDEGQALDMCVLILACDPGLTCLFGDLYLPGCAYPRCCSPFCDLTVMDACAGLPGSSCLPWYPANEAPPGQEDIGVCAAMV